jgi:hypothetical protein|tara:strand:- start:409 stop:648 length:240 start_codon:yes stop_codon:yes gene_type:complete
MSRSLNTISHEILTYWTKPYFGAVPYLNAMRELNSINDNYYDDTARTIVMYFLANASTFRGIEAKRIKLELKSMLNNKD